MVLFAVVVDALMMVRWCFRYMRINIKKKKKKKQRMMVMMMVMMMMMMMMMMKT